MHYIFLGIIHRETLLFVHCPNEIIPKCSGELVLNLSQKPQYPNNLQIPQIPRCN